MVGSEEALPADPGLFGCEAGYALSRAELAERLLRSSPYLALRNVTCDSVDGALVLRGCLPSYYLKQMAQAIVFHLEGVTGVINEIEVVNTPGLALRR